MKELTGYPQPQMPRFNAWRLVAMLSIPIMLAFLVFVGFFIYDLRKTNVNIAEFYLLSDEDQGQNVAILSGQLESLKADTARLGKKLRLMEATAPAEISVSNHGGLKLPVVKPYGRKPQEFATYGAYATEAMRYYRTQINELYKAAGSKYRVQQ